MPSGAEIVDDYIPVMMDRCQTSHGKIIVATLKELVIGFTTVLAEVRSDEIADGNVEYGLVYDLVVAGEFRGRGIGRQLLEAAETYARAKGVKWLRIGVLASNHSAAGLYDSMGFKPLYIEREKALL